MKRSRLKRGSKGLKRQGFLTSRASLSRKAKLRRRSLKERTKGDPGRYGEAFEAVRRLPCFGRTYLPLHTCGIGVAPPSAHHIGRKDSDGLLPVCGRLHDMLHDRPWEIVARLGSNGRNGKERLKSLALQYYEEATHV